MTKSEFAEYLSLATDQALKFGQLFVRQQLTSDVRYKLYPNHSYDGHPLVGDEEIFPADALEEGQFHGPLTAAEVVDFLWRDEKVPEWIDIKVDSVIGGTTFFQLLCCGRFTSTNSFLYYKDCGTGPFGVKGPDLPVALGWVSLEVSGKFDLHWMREDKDY